MPAELTRSFLEKVGLSCKSAQIAQQYWSSNKKPEYWPRLDFLFGKGVFHTNFSVTAPEFLISLCKSQAAFLVGLFLMIGPVSYVAHGSPVVADGAAPLAASLFYFLRSHAAIAGHARSNARNTKSRRKAADRKAVSYTHLTLPTKA